jgi:hypothetical protein
VHVPFDIETVQRVSACCRCVGALSPADTVAAFVVGAAFADVAGAALSVGGGGLLFGGVVGGGELSPPHAGSAAIVTMNDRAKRRRGR